MKKIYRAKSVLENSYCATHYRRVASSVVNATEDGQVRVRNPPVKVLDLHGSFSWHKPNGR